MHLRGSRGQGTIPHELEHNLRRYIEEDAQEQARLVSPAKDPTLRITDSIEFLCSAKQAS